MSQGTVPVADPVDRGPGGRFAWLARFVAARLDPKAYLGLHVTIGLGVVALSLWLFGAVLEEVLDNAAVVRMDVATMRWVGAHVTPFGLRVFGIVTRLGDVPVIPIIAMVGAFVLWRERRRLLLVCWTSAFVGGVALSQMLKRLVHRARPELAMQHLHIMSFSFPSGHTMAATIGYGMLGYMLVTHWKPRRLRRRFIVLGAVTLPLMVGVSRLYLGVHFPTDVLGGFAAGTAWLAICVTGMTIARKTPAVTPAARDPERVEGSRVPAA
jgi:membrane-associated phospholipid phosphatase